MRTAQSRLLLPLALVGALAPAAAAAQQRVTIPERPSFLTSKPAEVFRIGTDEGESWEMLSNVASVAFDRQDNLYVLDAGNHRVLVFDRGGRFLRQIGEQGQGPGEITFARAMVVAANGAVVVYDMGRGGYTIFDADGTYRSTISGATDSRILGGSNMQAAPGGGVVTRVQNVLRPGSGGALTPPTGPVKTPIVVHPLTEGATGKTLFEIEMPPPKIIEQGGSGNNRRIVMSMAPPVFTAPVGWGVLPTGGIAVTTTDDYAVRVLDADGRVQRVFSTGQQPRRVSNRDREAAREQRREQLRNPSSTGGISMRNVNGQTSYSFGGGAPQLTDAQIEDQLETLEFAETVPLIRGLFTDGTGRIWVQRTSDQDPTENGVIDLIQHDGRYIGSLRGEDTPGAVSPGGLAAYITRDEMDIEQIVVRRLPADWK
jgi:hypothetical protein